MLNEVLVCYTHKLKEESKELERIFDLLYKHLQITSFVSKSEENNFSCDLWYCHSLCHIYMSS